MDKLFPDKKPNTSRFHKVAQWDLPLVPVEGNRVFRRRSVPMSLTSGVCETTTITNLLRHDGQIGMSELWDKLVF